MDGLLPALQHLAQKTPRYSPSQIMYIKTNKQADAVIWCRDHHHHHRDNLNASIARDDNTGSLCLRRALTRHAVVSAGQKCRLGQIARCWTSSSASPVSSSSAGSSTELWKRNQWRYQTWKFEPHYTHSKLFANLAISKFSDHSARWKGMLLIQKFWTWTTAWHGFWIIGGGPGHMYSPHPGLITGGRRLDWYPLQIPDNIATVAQDRELFWCHLNFSVKLGSLHSLALSLIDKYTSIVLQHQCGPWLFIKFIRFGGTGLPSAYLHGCF